jgi:PTS system mannose-specific IIA component
MIGLIVITHGDFGQQLIKAAEVILGEQKEVWALSLQEKDGLETLSERIEKILKEGEEQSEGKIIFVDMLGGTPANASLKFVNQEKVEIISGVNLPMLIAGISYRQSLPLKELARLVRQKGEQSIVDVKRKFLDKVSRVKNKQ